MKTIVIQIGNSDDKLSQSSWADYISDVNRLLFSQHIHFSGGSAPDHPWQNYCWVIECEDDAVRLIEYKLTQIRIAHRQDSIAFTIGNTEFI